MTDRQRQLLADIEYAFAGVELGDGVSAHETRVIDLYGTDEERRAAREPDEKHDWRKLVDDPGFIRAMDSGIGGFCFLDAAGFRFYLPPCLTRVARQGEDELDAPEGLFFLLTHLSDYTRYQLTVLTNAQRECVCEVLLYVRDVHKPYFYLEAIDRAIESYWSRPAGEA